MEELRPIEIRTPRKIEKTEVTINSKKCDWYYPIIKGELNIETGNLTVYQD